MTIEKLKELLNENDETHLVDRIIRHAATLRGTRPFWNSKRRQLEGYFRNIEYPNLFFNFSAADLQWCNLRKHMPGAADHEPTPNESARLRKSRIDLQMLWH